MKKNIVIFIVILLTVLVVFWYLGSDSSTSSDSSLSAGETSAQSADAQYIYSLLQKMAQVKLDDSMFSNQVFQSLKDNTVSFPPQAAGRDNPFAPIGSSGGPVSTTTIRIKQ